jgi:hypothetical protein
LDHQQYEHNAWFSALNGYTQEMAAAAAAGGQYDAAAAGSNNFMAPVLAVLAQAAAPPPPDEADKDNLQKMAEDAAKRAER